MTTAHQATDRQVASLAPAQVRRTEHRSRPKTNEAKEQLVLRLREEGCTYRSIREQIGLALSTILRIICDEQDGITLKILIGFGLGFLFFTNPEA